MIRIHLKWQLFPFPATTTKPDFLNQWHIATSNQFFGSHVKKVKANFSASSIFQYKPINLDGMYLVCVCMYAYIYMHVCVCVCEQKFTTLKNTYQKYTRRQCECPHTYISTEYSWDVDALSRLYLKWQCGKWYAYRSIVATIFNTHTFVIYDFYTFRNMNET